MDQPQQQMEFFIRFFHHEKTVGAPEEICAPLLGCDLAAYRQMKARFAQEVLQAAQELLEDPEFAQAVDHLPFAPGSMVVAVGDSITDDYASWCEIMRQVLALRRAGDGIQLVNAGFSGHTTTEVIARFLDVVNQNPDWVIFMIGTNDARQHGLKPYKNIVSLEETEKNYLALRSFTLEQTHARLCWMTPTPVIPEQVASHWFLTAAQVTWSNDDLRQRADLLRRMPDPVVDLQAAFTPLDPAWLLDDGLHPSLAGQKVILRALVEKLT